MNESAYTVVLVLYLVLMEYDVSLIIEPSRSLSEKLFNETV